MKNICCAAVLALLLAGCDPLSLTALGVGGSTAVNHKLNGSPYRTFTAPIAKVKRASLVALRKMGIRTDTITKTETGEVITARAGKRQIEVELESLTENTTQMRVVARDEGIFYDAATASEIIEQTGKGLGA